MTSRFEHIIAVLPQTQCRQCGYDGCIPYAKALNENKAAINLCTPGGTVVIQDLADILQQPIQNPQDMIKAKAPKAIAIIDEMECIGCTACIKACPVDAILGATKQMHTVITDECTGCELCLAPCPVDCIVMQPVTDTWLPRAGFKDADVQNSPRFAAAAHAQNRFQHRQNRLAQLEKAKQDKFNKKQNSVQQQNSVPAKVNTMELIAKAMAKAQSQENQRPVPQNYSAFQQQQIHRAQQKATYRRAEHQLRYGTEEEKAIALNWLREYKLSQQNN